MSKELVVSSSPHETKLAILEDDWLVEIYIERESQQGLAGSIHKGRVTRVLPGMQSAFVNVGLERDAFLYVSDFFEAAEDLDEDVARKADIPGAAEDGGAEGEQPQPGGQRRMDRRQRRGRRRRRRGNRRGSGFPDSKYASLASTHEERESAPHTEPIEENSTGESRERTDTQIHLPESDFMVLPGESLAKYRNQPPAEDAASGAESSDSLETRQVEDPEPQQETAFEKAAVENAPVIPEERAEPDNETSAEEGGRKVSRGRARDASSSQTRPMSEAGFEESSSNSSATEREQVAGLEPNPIQENTRSVAEDGPGRLETGPSSLPVEVADKPESPEDNGDPENWEAQTQEAQPEEPSALRPETGDARAPDKAAGGGEDRGDESSQASDPDDDVAGESGADDPDEAPQSMPGTPLPQLEAVTVRGSAGSSRYSYRRRRRGRDRWARSDERAEEKGDEVSEVSDEPVQSSEEPEGHGKITSLLKKGMEILVQISKEPLGRKGARITSHIALPGRYLVYMPTVDHVGVSRKIFSDAERHRLRTVIRTHRTGMPGGFIARTAAEGAGDEDLRGDMLFLYNLWLDIRERAEKRSSTGLIHQDLDVVERILRDQLGENFKTIWVDGEEEYERILRFVERFQPQFLSRVKLYTRPRPIFDEFNITPELEKALRPKVWLKSGGYIVINQTEALVAIDVNTGKYVGKSDRLEDTIVNTNIEAAKEIVRQMRLRDLGGIIVVDFIDMEDRPNRQKVIQGFEEELRRDSAPSKVLSFNEFGLVSITRRRMRQSLERTLCSPCPYCVGSGSVKSIQTVILGILDDARKLASTMERQKDVTLRVNPEVGRHLKSRDNTYLQEIEEILHSHVLVRSDQSLHREHYDIN